MKRQLFPIAFGGALIAHAAPVTSLLPAKVVNSLNDCNLTWDSPSGDSFGLMPLGNGDVGANVWVENNGDLVFYLNKVHAFDAGHLLPKLGRVRLRLDPALDTTDFHQTLVLRDATIDVNPERCPSLWLTELDIAA